jgi:hypothetical protein
MLSNRRVAPGGICRALSPLLPPPRAHVFVVASRSAARPARTPLLPSPSIGSRSAVRVAVAGGTNHKFARRGNGSLALGRRHCHPANSPDLTRDFASGGEEEDTQAVEFFAAGFAGCAAGRGLVGPARCSSSKVRPNPAAARFKVAIFRCF